jgi:hypothetical protein
MQGVLQTQAENFLCNHAVCRLIVLSGNEKLRAICCQFGAYYDSEKWQTYFVNDERTIPYGTQGSSDKCMKH